MICCGADGTPDGTNPHPAPSRHTVLYVFVTHAGSLPSTNFTMIYSNDFASSHRDSHASHGTQDPTKGIATGTFNGTRERRTPSEMHTRREWTDYDLYAFVKERQTLMGIHGDPVPVLLAGMNIDSRECPVGNMSRRPAPVKLKW
jgi:hypothetical protein